MIRNSKRKEKISAKKNVSVFADVFGRDFADEKKRKNIDPVKNHVRLPL